MSEIIPNGVKLAVICGHGAGDPGACAGGQSEAELVRKLGAAIKQRGGNSVYLCDTSRNYYVDGGVNRMRVPNGCCVVELHMDSAGASARGAHVIINGRFNADKYDVALANGISKMFPGRAKIISKRTDLANINRAGRCGINYRLIENGFISNSRDREYFINHINDIADLYLSVFGIKSNGSAAQPTPKPTPQPKPSKPSKPSQAVIVDGWIGACSVKALQRIFGCKYVDGVISRQYAGSKRRHHALTTIKYGRGGSPLIKAMQRRVGVTADGYMGGDTIRAWQRFVGVKADGYFGNDTAKATQRWINKQLGGSTKSVTDIAREVIAGKWGNGSTRKAKLQAAGYSYAEVQREVNRLL